MAKSNLILGNRESSDRYKKLAYDSLGQIQKKGDREYAEAELEKM